MRRRSPQHFYAFDLLWLNGEDLRDAPLLERKRLLKRLVRNQPSPILYVEHMREGVALFEAVCAQDMEGVVAKMATGRYTPDETTWVKIYSQAEGRADFFDGRTFHARE